MYAIRSYYDDIPAGTSDNQIIDSVLTEAVNSKFDHSFFLFTNVCIMRATVFFRQHNTTDVFVVEDRIELQPP